MASSLRLDVGVVAIGANAIQRQSAKRALDGLRPPGVLDRDSKIIMRGECLETSSRAHGVTEQLKIEEGILRTGCARFE